MLNEALAWKFPGTLMSEQSSRQRDRESVLNRHHAAEIARGGRGERGWRVEIMHQNLLPGSLNGGAPLPGAWLVPPLLRFSA